MFAPAVLLSLAGTALAGPFKFPLPNGFPNPNAAALAAIEKAAGGGLPNTALPTALSAGDILDLQVIAANELYETAFFDSLLNNITNNVAGYECNGFDKTQVEAIIRQVLAQEELHAIGANAILKSAGAPQVQPCEYYFPSTTFLEAITYAAKITDLVLGSLQGVEADFAAGGGQGAGLIPLVASIIAQEGEQDGFYRFVQKKVPSASPFLSAAGGQFAFNHIAQISAVKGTCGKVPNVPLFDTLKLLETPTGKDQILKFTSTGPVSAAKDYITYINGQNTPISVGVTVLARAGGITTFSATFPFVTKSFANGLTVAALTKGNGFASAAEVAAATIAGPGLIEIN